jgi:RAB protein geranylgeranyltransferase component A
MKIKTVLVSSSFDTNIYPKSIACVECTVTYNEFEFNFRFVRKAEDDTIEDFIENDNLCQKEAFSEALKILKKLVEPIKQFEQLGKLTIEDSYRQVSSQVSNNKDKEFNNITNYKNKVIEIVNLKNWSVDKLSKFVNKYKNKSLNQLKEEDWEDVYNFLYNKFTNKNEREFDIDKSLNNKKSLERDISEREKNVYQSVDEELISSEEWDELI